eukprot:8832878-Lingulodinium_polyedra.AAC.1
MPAASPTAHGSPESMAGSGSARPPRLPKPAPVPPLEPAALPLGTARCRSPRSVRGSAGAR